MLFLLLGCLVLTYGAAAQHRLSSSIINTMRQFGAFLIDTFLSMASFATTLQGLYSLIGWTGVLVSFGIQVLELVATMGIIICLIPPWAKLKENVRYAHISGAATDKICMDKAGGCPVKKMRKRPR